MALTESYMLPLGTQASPFSLLNTLTGAHQTLENLKGPQGTLIIFMCNHCPYVIHLLDDLILSAKQLYEKKINTLAISSNSIQTHPQDGPKEMKTLALIKNFPFPYLYDESQETAHRYQAACTPDLYLFDATLKLYYRGRYDASRPGNKIPVSGSDLHFAVDRMLSQKPFTNLQYPSMGCNIKWHPGNSPEERVKN